MKCPKQPRHGGVVRCTSQHQASTTNARRKSYTHNDPQLPSSFLQEISTSPYRVAKLRRAIPSHTYCVSQGSAPPRTTQSSTPHCVRRPPAGLKVRLWVEIPPPPNHHRHLTIIVTSPPRAAAGHRRGNVDRHRPCHRRGPVHRPTHGWR